MRLAKKSSCFFALQLDEPAGRTMLGEMLGDDMASIALGRTGR
jgi:hypothetical protein